MLIFEIVHTLENAFFRNGEYNIGQDVLVAFYTSISFASIGIKKSWIQYYRIVSSISIFYKKFLQYGCNLKNRSVY